MNKKQVKQDMVVAETNMRGKILKDVRELEDRMEMIKKYVACLIFCLLVELSRSTKKHQGVRSCTHCDERRQFNRGKLGSSEASCNR